MAAPRSLARGLAVLELVAACPAGVPFRVLARQLALPNATVARLLQALVALGHLRHDAADGLYRPGDRLGWLGAQEDAEQRLRRCASQPLRDLAARHALTGLLLRWTGRHVICLDRAPAAGLPEYQAVGHVTLALLEAPWGVFLAPAAAWASAAADGRRWRTAERRRLLRAGWVRCRADDRRRLAAPLRDQTGSVVGALVLVGPPPRVDPRLDRLGQELAALAIRCSRQLRRPEA
jgi:DNA-binding IclR family transcriptional regulator